MEIILSEREFNELKIKAELYEKGIVGHVKRYYSPHIDSDVLDVYAGNAAIDKLTECVDEAWRIADERLAKIGQLEFELKRERRNWFEKMIDRG